MFRLIPTEVPLSRMNWTTHPLSVQSNTSLECTVCVSPWGSPRSRFLELVCGMVTGSQYVWNDGRRCVRGCEWKRRSNLNVKERLWVIANGGLIKPEMSMVWNYGPMPSEGTNDMKSFSHASSCRDGSVGPSVGRSVGPPLLSRLKYLGNYWMDIHVPQRLNPLVIPWLLL